MFSMDREMIGLTILSPCLRAGFCLFNPAAVVLSFLQSRK